MKLSILISLLTIFSALNAYSQDNHGLEPRVKSIEERTKKIEDEYKREMSNTRQELTDNNTLVKKYTAEVEKMSKHKLETDEARFQRCTETYKFSSEFVKSAKKSFKSIDVSLTQATLLQDITSLNNPTNNELGFSLKEVINQLIEKHITSKDKSLDKSGKLVNFVNGLLNNPITDLVKSAVPAINNVVSFISNISFGSKKIKEEDFHLFVKELQAYVKYYEGLAQATNEFQASIEQIKIRTGALEMILENYLVDRITDLYREKAKMQKPYEMDQLYNVYFSRDQIVAQTSLIKKENEQSLVRTLADPRLALSMTVVTQARFVQDDLEALTNQYINANKNYLQSIIAVLEYSKSLPGADKDKVDKKVASLLKQLDTWSSKFVSLVDVDDVKKQVKDLSSVLSIL
ncbi:MAG TPA: hypothetical protein VGN63_19165 [Flavisolibacter sp.]|jgi:hypothetical protein|nr:hypothetical protein [Flavisolibacter sp.]